MPTERRILKAAVVESKHQDSSIRVPGFRFSKAMQEVLDDSADAIAGLPD